MDQTVRAPWERHYAEGVDWHMPIPSAPLHRLLDEAAERFGDRPALDFLDRRYTYGQLKDLVDRAAKGFQALGVTKGTRVGLFLPNTPTYVVSYFAVLRAGGIVVNFNPLYAPREIKPQIEDSGVEIMVTLDLAVLHSKLAPMLDETPLKTLVVASFADLLPFPKNWLFRVFKRKEIARIPRDRRQVPFSRLLRNDGKPVAIPIDPRADVAVLQYTGGTTGVAKGAMLTHANLYANAAQAAAWYPAQRPGEERMLGVLPLFHVFAMTAVLNFSLRLGAELVLLPRFDLIQVMEAIHTKRPTMFMAVPAIYTAINHHRHLDRYDLSSIRFCISGGAPLPGEVREAFMRLTGCALVEGYGLTEASPVVTCNPVGGEVKSGSIGLPLPGTVVEIVSLEDHKTVLPPGETGEVCVRGPQVMKGYWNNAEETDGVLDGDRLHTGDVGVMDAEGYTFIVDRIKDIILCGGFNVYPRNVEEAIYQHPAVAECVVAGIPDEYRGQRVKAFVRLQEGASLTKEELIGFLGDKLAVHEIPRTVDFRDALPKTLIGKPDRKALVAEEIARRQAKAAKRGA